MAWGSCGHSLFLGVYTVHCGGAGLLGAGIDLAGRGLVSGHWGRGDDASVGGGGMLSSFLLVQSTVYAPDVNFVSIAGGVILTR